MTWFYFSFCDASLPKGEQFLGGCYVQVPEDFPRELIETQIRARRGPAGEAPDEHSILLAAALNRSHALGINPGGEVKTIGPIPDDLMDEQVLESDRERLLTRAELEGDG